MTKTPQQYFDEGARITNVSISSTVYGVEHHAFTLQQIEQMLTQTKIDVLREAVDLGVSSNHHILLSLHQLINQIESTQPIKKN